MTLSLIVALGGVLLLGVAGFVVAWVALAPRIAPTNIGGTYDTR